MVAVVADEDLSVVFEPGAHVATVEIRKPPANYFDTRLLRALATAFERLDADSTCRAIVLCSEGKHFCAGRDFTSPDSGDRKQLYAQAARLLEVRTPWIAAVQGGAIGGGLGLAMTADFRVCAPNAYFTANFARLGFHHGFGLTVTLPQVVGQQRANQMLLTGERVNAETAAGWGLVDLLAGGHELRTAAIAFADRIAASAPQAVSAIRETMRRGLVARFLAATEAEGVQQERLKQTHDFREGLAASRERRAPRFLGR
jgi:enoyl-CoA hydratase/carnithine racemase